jgi:transposase
MQSGKKSLIHGGKKWMLHHDNAPERASLLICEFLAENETTVVPQPPYSPDHAPADFFLFPKLKSTLKGRRCESTE